MNWHDYFYYDGTHLVHREREEVTKWDKAFNTKYSGKIVDNITELGYVIAIISCNGMRVCRRAHRVIWEMHFGEIPNGMEIDHINHVRSDNGILNLRLVKKRDNMLNKAKYNNSSTKITGVSWHKRDLCWTAYINIDGRRFSLGYFDSLFDACCARKSAELKFGFHKNHGA